MARRRRNSIDDYSLAQVFDSLKSDYTAAKSSRFRRKRTVPASGSGADYHYRSEADYLRVMEYARDMDRNDCIVGQTVDRAVANTLQDGFSLDPNTGDEELDARLSARWIEWAEDPEQCDLAGELSFADMEELVLRHNFVDGDILALPNEGGSLELVEAHRLRTPLKTTRNVVHGILLDENRRRLEYWFTTNDVDPSRSVKLVRETRPINARDAEGYRQVFHVFTGKRVSQTRGISAFAPIFDLVGMFEDINFAKLVQQQIVSCFAIFRQYEESAGPLDVAQRGERSTESLSDGSTRTIEGIAPGMEVKGLPGEKLTGFSPNVPNPEFFDHAKLILQLVGINLGMPLGLVLLDPAQSSFSSWRGSVDQARLGFRRNQRRLRRRFHTPVYVWKVRQWMAEEGQLESYSRQSGINIFRHRFNVPGWPYIEPLKDASADLLRTRNALVSHRRRCAERGIDWGDLSTEIVADNALLIRKAKETADKLNQDFADLGVTWREVAMLPTPDGVKIDLQPALMGSDKGQKDEN